MNMDDMLLGSTEPRVNVVENIATSDKKLKMHKAEQWEIDAIGKFLFELYTRLVLGVRSKWLVRKYILRDEFRNYLQRENDTELRRRLLEANGTVDIGTLLYRTRYLINTKRGCDSFLIKSSSLFQYVNKKIEEFDDKRKNGEAEDFMIADKEPHTSRTGDPALQESLQVDDNAPVHELIYEGSLQQLRSNQFQLTNMSCYICQLNFYSPDGFEEHIEEHGDESDFKLLKDYTKSVGPIFTLSYNVCKSSHYFRFNLKCTLPDVVIEKLAIVQTRTFYYVHNTRVPYELDADRKDMFYVDSHLFRKGVVQPIVVVFHEKFNRQLRYVEQHHFCRIEEFPAVKLSINPCRLSNKVKFKPKFKLPQYMPPAEMRNALKTDSIDEPLCSISNDFRNYLCSNKTLTQQNICSVLLTLLQIEDWDTMREYSSLVQHNVKLRKYEKDYIVKLRTPKHIRVENIIFPYDDVIVLPGDDSTAIPTTMDGLVNEMEKLITESDHEKQSSKKKSKSYLGEIECISNGRVTFTSKQNIPEYKSYTILFRPSRMVLRYQYRALEQLAAMSPQLLKRMLFPDEVMARELPAFRLQLHNENIYTNPEQLQAIQCVLHNSVEPKAPYIIFGPPGTGKTTTLVEAILQIYILQPSARILITAGSNGACDEIALRLCKVLSPLNHTKAITRIYSRSSEHRSDNINELLLEHSNLYADHFLPDVGLLHAYRIVVCTLSIIGRLATGKFGKDVDGSGIFTHVFVDEVAASTEAETLVGIMATLNPTASLVISGDHRQLGPILNSKRAAHLGLEMSLMERLLARDCYRIHDDGTYNREIQTRLCRNFRSHPEIVNLYSKLYYDGMLKPEADPAIQQLCRDWHRAPNADYPIIFHSIFGKQQCEHNSTSWYNPLELSAIMDYVRDLMYFGINGDKIMQSDIGIITPYKKQYMRIQEELNLRNWYQIETGAVESFQGKEKRILIVSFVRSFSKTLGFLENPRRLNVILSRACSLLILIGNPKTLSMNDDFKYIIDECRAHGTMIGANCYEQNDKSAPTQTKDETVVAPLPTLAKSMEQLSVGKKNGAENVRNGNISNKGKENGMAAGIAGANNAHPNDSATAEVALKTKNSSAFKPAKGVSAEKQRQTFNLYKELYLTDEPRDNDKNNKSEIDELFDALPRVPRYCRYGQARQTNDLQDFEVLNIPTKDDCEQTTKNKSEQRQQMKSPPMKQTSTAMAPEMSAAYNANIKPFIAPSPSWRQRTAATTTSFTTAPTTKAGLLPQRDTAPAAGAMNSGQRTVTNSTTTKTTTTMSAPKLATQNSIPKTLLYYNNSNNHNNNNTMTTTKSPIRPQTTIQGVYSNAATFNQPKLTTTRTTTTTSTTTPNNTNSATLSNNEIGSASSHNTFSTASSKVAGPTTTTDTSCNSQFRSTASIRPNPYAYSAAFEALPYEHRDFVHVRRVSPPSKPKPSKSKCVIA